METKEEEIVDIDLDDPEVKDATLKIQAGFGRLMARKKVAAKKEHPKPKTPPKQKQEDEVDIDLEDPEVQAAAVKIQSSFRGHIRRQKVDGHAICCLH